jgi:aspartate/methionine/tyrosine aminotransferase
MSPGDSPLRTVDILRLHEELETTFNDGNGGDFLFGWQSINPFADDLIAATKTRAAQLDYTKYSYMESDHALSANVRELHRYLDGRMPESVFCAASGGTSVLFALSYWLSRIGVREVYYIPPIYFTLLNGLRQFGIHTRAVSGYHAFESSFSMNLPLKTTVLMFADPIWYAGIPVPANVIDEVAAWQRKTGSLIFVDGSFQYMKWNNAISEPTSALDPSNTIRLVSPTKSLVVHGYRFAYALMPEAFLSKFSNSYANICGPAGADSIAFAYEAVSALRARTITQSLMTRSSTRHTALRDKGVLDSPLYPSAGYFVFEKINKQIDGNLRMDGRYFGQPRFPEHTRLNLLSTQFHLLET